MMGYYYSWYTLPESMLLDDPRRVWGVYRIVQRGVAWKIAVCDTEEQAERLTKALMENRVCVETGV